MLVKKNTNLDMDSVRKVNK